MKPCDGTGSCPHSPCPHEQRKRRRNAGRAVFTLALADGTTVTGSIQGAGGRIGPEPRRIARAIKLANEGRDHGFANPDFPDRTTGRVYLYPTEDAPPLLIDLKGARVLTIEVVP